MKSNIKTYRYSFHHTVCLLQALLWISVLFLRNLHLVQLSLLIQGLIAHTGFQVYLYPDAVLLCDTIPREI